MMADVWPDRTEERVPAPARREISLEAVLNSSADLVIVFSLEGDLIWMSPSCDAYFGSIRSEPGDRRNAVASIIHERDRQAFRRCIERLRRGSTEECVVMRLVGLDGSTSTFETMLHNHLGDPTLRAIVAIARNVTKRLVSDGDLATSERRLLAIMEHTHDLAMIVDAGRCRWVSPTVERILGYEPEVLFGRLVTDKIHPDDRQDFDDLLRMATDPGFADDAQPTFWRVMASDGTYRLLEGVVSRWNGDDSSDGALIINAWDATENEASKTALQGLSARDPLTGLGNRRALERLDTDGSAVLFIHIDGLHDVNSSYGHDSGDMVMVEIARRIAHAAGVLPVVHHGGAEFVLFAGTDEHGVRLVAEVLLVTVGEPVALDEHRSAHVGVSIGVAMAEAGEPTGATRDRAAHALVTAKARGGGIAHWDAELARVQANVRHLYRAINEGLRRDEFEVYYQPIIDIVSRRIIGAEALLRWHHPTEGLTDAYSFAAVAEQTGLMDTLGQRALLEACRAAGRWALPASFRLRVNATAHQLSSPSFVHDIRVALSRSGLPPNRLGIEITEGVLLARDDTVEQNLRWLRALGIRVDVDDFGTGYSSLLYLKHFPIDGIKLDRAFVSGLGEDATDEAIVQSLTMLATTLGIELCGEGVEEERQLDGLLRHGVQTAQGYLFSKAVSAQQFEELLAVGSL